MLLQALLQLYRQTPAQLRKLLVHQLSASRNSIKSLAVSCLAQDHKVGRLLAMNEARGLRIKGEGDTKHHMAVVTPVLIENVKARLHENHSNYALVGLIQLNTGMRLSELVFARVEDCILDHPILHLWVRQNRLSDRKTKSSIRAVPLYGISLEAATTLYERALHKRSA